MKKVTKEIKKVMIEMKEKGLSSYAIAKILNINQATVQYHTDEDYKKRVKETAKKRNYKWDGKKTYHKKYMKDRYNSDEEFREKQKERSRNYQARKYAEKKEQKMLKDNLKNKEA